MADNISSIEIINSPLTLPCGLTLPNRLVKCPMQETLAKAPFYDPPVESFENLYAKWARSSYGLLITGQVQIDRRFLSVPGDVVCHAQSLEEPHFSRWKRWAAVAQAHGTPCIVQLAHPGRMSRAGAGERPPGMQTWCASSVPVKLGDSWIDRLAQDRILGVPKAMTREDIDEAVGMWLQGVRVAKAAGFAGITFHAAHGFLLSQFLSPHTNRRDDEYGGSAWGRMKLLRRLVEEAREIAPRPFCVAVKVNSADYMGDRGLQQEEGLEQVRWLLECGMVDFVELSGGNAEQKHSGLHNSFGYKSMTKAPERSESTRIREAFFTEFAEKVMAFNSDVPIQLSGGFRSRNGMADALDSGLCQLIGLGRAAVLEPELPATTILNPLVPDSSAVAMSHQVQGLWLLKFSPAKVIGASLPIHFFYHNMRRLGRGLKSDPDITLLGMIIRDKLESIQEIFSAAIRRVFDILPRWTADVKLE